MRWVAAIAPVTSVWATYDESIKTMQDFAGKKVHIKRKGALDTPDLEDILKAANLYDKVELFRGGWGTAKGALKDGLVDVSIMMVDHVLPAAFGKGALIQDLETKGPIHYIPMDPQILRDLTAIKPGEVFPVCSHGPVTIFPGALDKTTQPEPLNAAFYTIFWGADEAMSDDIVAEVVRIMMKRADQFPAWHFMGGNMSKEFLPTWLYSPDLMHEGAKKYFEDEGIEVGNFLDLLP